MDQKPFYASRTFWGLVIILIGSHSPKLAGLIQTDLDGVIEIAGQVAALAGVVLAFIGRLKANTNLTIKKEKE